MVDYEAINEAAKKETVEIANILITEFEATLSQINHVRM
jgi:hypothetical protein